MFIRYKRFVNSRQKETSMEEVATGSMTLKIVLEKLR
jgi:hypothetical protein